MHARRLIAAAAFLAALIPSAPLLPDQSAPVATPTVRQAAAHENAFAFNLLHAVEGNASTGNVFLSPLSIDQAVSMLAAGAGGQTLAEIDNTLQTGNSKPDALGQAAAMRYWLLAHSGAAGSSVDITVANALWSNRGITLRPEYVAACRRQLDARASTLDFGQPSAAKTINQWVGTQTRGKIDSIVQQSDLAGASAVLTDAVYFHGRWDSPFEASDTTSAPFHTASGAAKTLPMMTQTQFFPAAQTDAFQAIALPYGHSGISMVVVLPRAGRSLDALARSMTPAQWDGLTSSLHGTNVQLFLPRFHLDYSTGLAKSLSTLGMRRVFSPAADLSPMSSTPLYVSSVIHKTTLDVDEKGTVATAATGIINRAMAVRILQQPLTIRVDHPFLCAIRDDATGALLFLGCVRDPQPIK